MKKKPLTIPVNLDRLDELEHSVHEHARWVGHQGRTFYIGVDVCKVLGLAPSNGYGVRGYRKHFAMLSPDETITLATNFGGNAHQRVMVNSDGVRTLCWRALQLECEAYCRILRKGEQEGRRKCGFKPVILVEPVELPEWAQVNSATS